MKKKLISGLMSIVMLMTCLVPIPAAASALPSSYGDTSRTVRDQDTWGSCWSFACTAMLEQKILHDEGKDVDLSEEHILQRTSSADTSTEWNMTTKDNGGSYNSALGYYLSGHGPALENEFPYEVKNDIGSSVTSAVKGYTPSYRVTGVRSIIANQNPDGTLTDSAINKVKTAIYNHGGVFAEIYANGSQTIYGKGTGIAAGAYYGGGEGNDHGVCIIGWDDNYPASYFNTSKVTKNGAFLARNSWGSNSGDNGYLWISYDSVDLTPRCYISSYEKVSKDENLYSLETIGLAGVASADVPDDGMIGYINVFDIKNETEAINEVVFGIPDIITKFDVTYKVYYMPVDSSGKPNAASKQLIASGTVSEGGYYYIKPNKTINVSGKAAIMVSTCDADDYAYIVKENNVGNYKVSYKAGTSFKYKEQFGTYKLYEDSPNYGIKLITKTVTTPVKPPAQTIDASKFTISAISAKTYTGKAITPAVTVKYGNKTLTKGTHYTVAYSNNINAGTAKVTITGKGPSYKGSITKTFTIKKASVASCSVPKLAARVYTGKLIKPAVNVKYSSRALKAGTDYTIVYKNNKYCGKATYTITGKGNYTGTKSGYFYVKPTKSTITSLTKAKKAFTVKMRNSSAKITGYQVGYKKSGGTYKYKYTTASKLKVSKLTSKKTYYVKVRAYKTISGKKVYGNWSTVKKVKVK